MDMQIKSSIEGGVCRKHGTREGSEGCTNYYYVVEGEECRKHEVQHIVCNIQCMEVSA